METHHCFADERCKIENSPKITADQHQETFSARGEILTFEGFLKVYLEGVDDDEEEAQGILPPVQKAIH